MSCVNENCKEDALNSIAAVIVNLDGDLACCFKCQKEYERQKERFFNVIVHDEKKCERWLQGASIDD